MQARIRNVATIFPDVMAPFQALARVAQQGGLPPKTAALVHLRVSQINGCAVCVDGGVRHARKSGETDERLHAAAVWRDAPYFTEPERAALALAESATRLADRADAVPDAAWEEAARHYDEKALGALVLSIAMTNLWNRLNAVTRQVAGQQSW